MNCKQLNHMTKWAYFKCIFLARAVQLEKKWFLYWTAAKCILMKHKCSENIYYNIK